MVDEFDKASCGSLTKIGGMQSIILHPTNSGFSNVSKEILNGLKKLPALRFFDVNCDVENLNLHSVGYLKHLRYLNLSYSKVSALPDNICDLLNLQTLKLNNCFNLECLPKDMKDLINLRHLYLEGCSRLKYMPGGMGQLKHLKTLSLFVISEEIDHCQLDELKELDIGGSLEIRNLERVSEVSLARERISFADKESSINMLELHWKYDDKKKKNIDKEVVEALQVPTTRLEILKMWCYKGASLPTWVEETSSSIIHIELYCLKNLKHIFTMNTGNSDDDDDGMVLLFPLLQNLDISHMMSLRELVSYLVPRPLTFPSLCKMNIFNCPKLGSLSPHLKSLKDLSVGGKCSDELLYSLSNLSGLTRLKLFELDKRSVLFPKAMFDEKPSTFQSLRQLKIKDCSMLSYLYDDGMIMHLPLLRTLKIKNCQKLVSLSRKHHIQGGGTRGVTNLGSLTKLHIENCPELVISLEEFGGLNNSLQNLYIIGCPKIMSSEEYEVDNGVIELLLSIRTRLGHNNFNVDLLE